MSKGEVWRKWKVDFEAEAIDMVGSVGDAFDWVEEVRERGDFRVVGGWIQLAELAEMYNLRA